MKKAFQIIMSFALCFSLIGIRANDVKALSGEGTAENPYIIETAEDLTKLNQSTDYIYAELAANIDLSTIDPIQQAEIPAYIPNFKGELDGNGYTIMNAKSGTALIYTYYEGELKNFTWNVASPVTLVWNQRPENDHKYTDIDITGEIKYGSGNNNESPLLVYATGSTTMKRVTIDIDMSSPTYQGLFIGYEPYINSDYSFIDCTVKGTYVGEHIGVLFGNGSMSATSAYGLQHIAGVLGVEKTSALEVSNLVLDADILGISSIPHLLCGVSYNETLLSELESELENKTTGYDSMRKAEELNGYVFAVNDNGNLRIEVKDTNSEIGSFLVVSELYSNVFTNGVPNGTYRHAVSERINVSEGIDTYYSSLGKVQFYDGTEGEYGSTGVDGSLRTITVNGNTYYALTEEPENYVYTFNSFDQGATHSNTARTSNVKVYVYGKDGSLLNIVSGPVNESFVAPELSIETDAGNNLKDVTLSDSWQWVDDTANVIYGGQIFFAKDGNTIAPVFVNGLEVKATSITLNKTDVVLQSGNSDTLTATIFPANTTFKDVTWTSNNPNIVSVDNNGTIVALSSGSAVITATSSNGLSASCTVTVPAGIYNVEGSDISSSTPVEEVTVGVEVDNNTESILSESISEDLQNVIDGKIEEGKDVVVEIATENLDLENISADVKSDVEKVEAFVSKNDLKVAQYFDLSIFVKSDGDVLGNITETNRPLTFKIAIPEELKKEGRVFTVVRVHEGKAEELKTVEKDGILEFETDKFSTYALTYKDVEETPVQPEKPSNPVEPEKPTETPNTNGMSLMFCYGMMLILSAMILLVLAKKRSLSK